MLQGTCRVAQFTLMDHAWQVLHPTYTMRAACIAHWLESPSSSEAIWGISPWKCISHPWGSSCGWDLFSGLGSLGQLYIEELDFSCCEYISFLLLKLRQCARLVRPLFSSASDGFLQPFGGLQIFANIEVTEDLRYTNARVPLECRRLFFLLTVILSLAPHTTIPKHFWGLGELHFEATTTPPPSQLHTNPPSIAFAHLSNMPSFHLPLYQCLAQHPFWALSLQCPALSHSVYSLNRHTQTNNPLPHEQWNNAPKKVKTKKQALKDLGRKSFSTTKVYFW